MSFRKLFFVVLIVWGSSDVLSQGYQTEITVALDGSGDFSSIQEAVLACKAFPDVPITIRIKNG